MATSEFSTSIDGDGVEGVYKIGSPDTFHATDYYDGNRKWIGSTLRNTRDSVDLYTDDIKVRTGQLIVSYVAVRAEGGAYALGANGGVSYVGMIQRESDTVIQIPSHDTAKETTRPWGKDLDEWIEEDPNA